MACLEISHYLACNGLLGILRVKRYINSRCSVVQSSLYLLAATVPSNMLKELMKTTALRLTVQDRERGGLNCINTLNYSLQHFLCQYYFKGSLRFRHPPRLLWSNLALTKTDSKSMPFNAKSMASCKRRRSLCKANKENRAARLSHLPVSKRSRLTTLWILSGKRTTKLPL